jgi:YihY family inner membrane protein
MADSGVTNAYEPGMTQSQHHPDQSPTNPAERVVRRFDRWQQRHGVISFPIAVVKKFGDDEAGNLVGLLAYNSFVAAFPLLLAFTAILGVTLREYPGLHAKLVNSAFAEFPIIGGQIHDQLGVETFSSTLPSLMIGVAGALVGGRGFAHTLQNTLNTVWAVPKVDRPGFFPRYLRTLALLLLLGLIVVVTGGASTAAATATSLGFGGLPARVVSLAVGTALGFGFFVVLFRIAAAGRVPTRSMLFGAAVSALGWQILLTAAGIVVAHQLRHAQAVAGFFGVVLGLLAWLALQATVIVFAIEIDAVRAKRLWPRSIVPPPLTDADKSYYASVLRAEVQRPEQRLDLAYETDENAETQAS